MLFPAPEAFSSCVSTGFRNTKAAITFFQGPWYMPGFLHMPFRLIINSTTRWIGFHLTDEKVEAP